MLPDNLAALAREHNATSEQISELQKAVDEFASRLDDISERERLLTSGPILDGSLDRERRDAAADYLEKCDEILGLGQGRPVWGKRESHSE
jgi:septal ring factor EnvC (AmiA/AmiB activator)